jgi:multidrug efflux pump subunit AcrB
MNMSESVVKASMLRFRPVLMTAVTTIFGMLPIAFSTGAGSESRNPMGMVVIGGMLLSTLLTLVVIPVVHIRVQKVLQLLKLKG